MMDWMTLLYIFLYLFFNVSSSESNIHPLRRKLNNWHALKSNELKFHREKRSLGNRDSISTVDKQVSFEAFGKQFTLSLVPTPEIFSPGFKAHVLSKNAEHEVTLDKSSVFKGKVLGDPKSEVTAHLNGRTLTASIETNNETYVVEPIWRHVPIELMQKEHHHSSDMLVYRHSDLNLTQFSDPHSKFGFCNTEQLMEQFRNNRNSSNEEKEHSSVNSHHRMKRAAGDNKKICKITLVADYRFYQEMGNGSSLETMYYLINLIERVNKIYKNTNWAESGSMENYIGYGFQISEIKIHNETTPDPRYNQNRTWVAQDLLEAFSETNYSECLSHLFTYVDFANGLLGLAYVGSDKRENVGGICTKPYTNRGKGKPPLYLNTGLTSTINWGQKILTTEADLVTAHELGHNFGAEHDDVTTSGDAHTCSPGQSNNGNYIMYPAAVSGQYPNNKKFSECSKHNILRSLQKKAHICFQEDNKSLCGNYQVEKEDGETCDVGYLERNDPCCSPNCSLKSGAKCSIKNYPCCSEDCQAASSHKLCRAHIRGLCHQDVYCDGINFDCPAPAPVPDDVECGDSGKCKNGQCIQFCYTKGLQSCLCSMKKEEFCMRCCAPLNATGDEMIKKCRPYTEGGTLKPERLQDNSTCTLGYCSKGVCNKQTQDVIERVWDIFKHIAPDKIGEFLADNIVGAVLVFSLLFWIPCSCLVNLVDKRRLQQRQKDEKWLTERGAEFSRSTGFRGVPGGSAPVTPRTRVQRVNVGWNSGNVARSGFGARDQWRAAQERGNVIKKSSDNLVDRLDVVPGSPNDSEVASPSSIMRDNQLPYTGPLTHASSHPSLTSPLASDLSDKSFDGEVKPIAASSATDVSVVDDDDCVVVAQDHDHVTFRRPGLQRQEAITLSPT